MHFPFEKEILLENPAVLIRPIEIADIEPLLDVATRDKDLLQFSPSQIYSENLLSAYVKKAIENRSKKIRYTFVVYDKKSKAFAGSTSFLNISDENDRLEIGGTWYGKAFQRTGLNQNCKHLLLEYAFHSLGAERVEFKTDERNIASRGAIEKTGGQLEGILRSHTLMYDGYRRNTVCYSILRTEWNDIREMHQKGKI